MAFGAELKDFVSGFQAGYNLVDSPEEKERKRAAERRAEESHKRTGDWHDDDEADEDDDRKYNRGRHDIEDKRNAERDKFDREKTARDDAFRTEDLSIRKQSLDERRKAFRLKYRQLNEPVEEQDRAIDDMIEDDNQTAIPDEEGNNMSVPDTSNQSTQNGFQPASYSDSAERNMGFVEVVNAGKGFTEIGRPDGTIVVRKGPRNWRNNNPGNIEYGSFAKKLGAIGTDGRFAVFPTYEDGRKAKASLLFESPNYRDKTLAQAISRYAPSFENDTGGYISQVAKSAGITTDTRLSDLTTEQRDMMMDAMQKVEGFRTGKEQVLAMASGGLVPDDLESQMQAGEDATLDYQMSEQDMAMEDPEEGAIPDDVPVPRPRPDYDGAVEGEEPTDDIWELARRSVRDGLKKSIADAGMDKEAAIEDEEEQKAQENYLNGYGAAPSQMMKQVMDKIDPDRQMPASERNMKAMGYVYRYYMDQGKTEEAKAAAASMVQYYRAASSRFLAMSQAAAEEGDIDNAAQAAIAAYANIPNGRDLKIMPVEGGYEVSVTDTKTGKKITRQIVSPREFAAAAMKFTPTTFDDEILNAAGMEPEKVSDASPEELGKVAETTGMDERWTEGVKVGDQTVPMNADRTAALKNAATSIAGLKENQMSTDEALRFVDPSDTQPFKAEKMRGNPDVIVVTKQDGSSIMMRKNAFVAWQGARKSIAEEAAKLSADAKKPGWFKETLDVGEKTGIPAAAAFIDSEVEATGKDLRKFRDSISTPNKGESPTIPEPDLSEATPERLAARRERLVQALERWERDPEANADMIAKAKAEIERIDKTAKQALPVD